MKQKRSLKLTEKGKENQMYKAIITVDKGKVKVEAEMNYKFLGINFKGQQTSEFEAKEFAIKILDSIDAQADIEEDGTNSIAKGLEKYLKLIGLDKEVIDRAVVVAKRFM